MNWSILSTIARPWPLSQPAAYTEAIENIRPKCETLKYVIVIGDTQGDQISYADLLKEDGASLPYVETHKDDPHFFCIPPGPPERPKGSFTVIGLSSQPEIPSASLPWG